MTLKVYLTKIKLVGRVLLLEDDLVMGEWIGSSLSRLGIEVHLCGNLEEALNELKKSEVACKYHAIITDVFMREGKPDGLRLLREGRSFDIPVFVITSSASLDLARDALKYSACALLEKPFEIHDLHSKLLEVWQEPSFLTALVERAMEVNSLTLKEKEVCRLLVKGLSNREIAAALGVTEKTIKFHVTSIFEKFEVKSRSELQNCIFPS